MFVGKGIRALGVAALVLAAAAQAATASNLRWGYRGEILSMDPQATNESSTLRFLGNIYDALVTRDKDNSIVPWLAREWQVVEPTRWRFRLRENVRFHEGQPLTAEDVAATIARAAQPSSGLVIQVTGIARVEVVDPLTVDIITHGPRPTLLAELSNVMIMSKPWMEANNALEAGNVARNRSGHASRATNGTGAYRLRARVVDSRTELERNPAFWGPIEGNVQTVVFRPIQSDATRVAALLSGELDLIHPVPLQDVPRLQGRDGITVQQVPENRTIYLAMNVQGEKLANGDPNPMRDRRVREALYRAINIDALMRVVMRGFATPAAIMAAPGVVGHSAALDRRMPHDEARARALLREAGFANGFRFGFDCPNDRYINDEAICQAVVGMLARIGVQANLRMLPKTVYLQRLQAERPDMYLLGWGPNSFDALETLFYNIATREDMQPAVRIGGGQGRWNLGRYSNPAVDQLLFGASRELDPAKRTAALSEALRLVADDIPVLPIHNQAVVWALRRGVRATPTGDDAVNVRWITIN
ncbi:MAG: ABC transporter substrate-binding protein [Alphaproteobacteria bacterium]|nr:ABC transporter substrate-binding protein [Alphaproteobacteria bacterium]